MFELSQNDTVTFCVEYDVFELSYGAQLRKAIDQCETYVNTTDCFPGEQEISPANHIRARTVGVSVAGSAGAVAFTVAGGTGALLAYRRHHDIPVVDVAGTVDGEWEVIEENVIFSLSELEHMHSMPFELTDIPVNDGVY